MIGAAVGAVFHLLFNKESRSLFRPGEKLSSKGVALYILSGILTISAQSCLMASMYFIPISIANLITLSTPVIVTPVSYFLLKNAEKLSWISVLGICLALFGICMIVI
jgi:drug/metabolite transporter (DMT)-like permease